MNYDSIKIENQICFPLYACSKEIIRKYKPYLDKLNLTYTQYIAMMIMWDLKKITVNELGKHLYLDSGTLTPLLKKLEEKEYIIRNRSTNDERYVNIEITKKGINLREEATNIQKNISTCIDLSEKEAIELYRLLYKVLARFDDDKR